MGMMLLSVAVAVNLWSSNAMAFFWRMGTRCGGDVYSSKYVLKLEKRPFQNFFRGQAVISERHKSFGTIRPISHLVVKYCLVTLSLIVSVA